LELVNEGYDSLKFGVNSAAAKFSDLSTFQPVNSRCLDASAIDLQDDSNQNGASKNMVVHDFVRYLALKLFNNSKATDLFSNQKELLGSIRATSATQWGAVIAILQDDTQAGGIDGTDPGNMKAHTESGISNVSYHLFEQLIKQDPTRFQDMSAGGFAMDEVEHPGIYAIPFSDGDKISFRVTLTPHAGQQLATKPLATAASDELPSRVYLVHLVCTNDPDAINPIPDINE